jgi:glutamyl-Q tRNA(Asp) synthetase
MAGYVTRFAPSPTGPLHLGHAFSALTAWDRARAADGVFLLRIEDIDRARCRALWEEALCDDLRWLGLDWPTPVIRQSGRIAAYTDALTQLDRAGLIYPCHCSRADIRTAMSAPQESAVGPDGPVYPGTCRGRTMADAGPGDAIRLDMARAMQDLEGIFFHETGPLSAGVHLLDPDFLLSRIGDAVLSRRDMGTSYHLSVVVDDAAQKVTEVVRGHDLFEATFLHVLLQRLLRLPTPAYHHHRLIRDEQGKRLAKRDDARAIALYRGEGATPADIRRLVGL